MALPTCRYAGVFFPENAQRFLFHSQKHFDGAEVPEGEILIPSDKHPFDRRTGPMGYACCGPIS
jgi:hypothetical protein